MHKTANVLDAMPKRLQPRAKTLLHEMAEAPTEADAKAARERFRAEFDAKYPKATGKLDRDWNALTAFYSFPAEHWRHLRTTNPIESSFATVRLRTKVTKGAGSKKAALAMAYKLLDAAQDLARPASSSSRSSVTTHARSTPLPRPSRPRRRRPPLPPSEIIHSGSPSKFHDEPDNLPSRAARVCQPPLERSYARFSAAASKSAFLRFSFATLWAARLRCAVASSAALCAALTGPD